MKINPTGKGKMMSILADRIMSCFEETFKRMPAIIVRSPGRVNLLGEHTDYNEGFVLPAAIDRAIYLAVAERPDRKIVIHSLDFNQSVTIDLENPEHSPLRWPDYFTGVVSELAAINHTVNGVDCVFGGDIPIGAGLASSAALEGGFGYALNSLFDLGITPINLVKIGQRAENNFVGVRCGVMDQYINIFGREGRVIRLDCRSLLLEYYPFSSDRYQLILCDTGIKHELSKTDYNKRRQQCEESVKILKRFDTHIKTLRDVSMHFLDTHADALSAELYQRSSFVIRENFRVLNGCRDLQNQDYNAFGNKMFLSHTGLRDDFQVSIPELDLLVEKSGEFDGVIGARMMGAGFGGCTITLIKVEKVKEFERYIKKAYRQKTGKTLKIYICSIKGGVSVINL